MRSRDECLREAEWCEKRAATSTNEELRRTFEQIARRWRSLAATYGTIANAAQAASAPSTSTCDAGLGATRGMKR